MSNIGTLSVALTGDMSGLTKSLNSASKEVEGFAKQAESLAKKFDEAGKKITSVGKKMSAAITAPLVALGALSVQEAAATDRLTASLEGLAGGAEEANKYLAAIKDTSLGTISTVDALGIANKALSLNVVDTADKMAQLTEIAITLGRAQGLDAKQAVDDLTTALGRQSPMILDNLGITLKLEEAYTIYAKQLGKTADQLTDTEKQQAFLNAALEKGSEVVERLGGIQEDSAAKFERLRATFSDLRGEIGELLLPVIEDMTEKITDWIDQFRELDTKTQRTIIIVAAAAAAVGPLLIVVGQLTRAVGLLSSALAYLAAHPIVAVIAVVASLVTAWAAAQEGIEGIGNWILEFFIDLTNSLITLWNGWKTAVEYVVNGIITALNLIPLVNIPQIDIDPTPYLSSLERVNSATTTTSQIISSFKSKLEEIDDVRYDALIEELNAVKKSVEDLPADEAAKEFQRLATEIVEQYAAIYPELSRLSKQFIDDLDKATVTALENVEKKADTTATILGDEFSNLLLQFQVTVKMIQDETDESLEGIRKKFIEAYTAVEDAERGTVAWAEAVEAFLPVYDDLVKLQELFKEQTGEINPQIQLMIDRSADLNLVLGEASAELYRWGDALKDFFAGIKSDIENTGQAALTFLNVIKTSITDSLSDTLIQFADYRSTRELEEQEHQENIAQIKEQYADSSAEELEAALAEEEQRYRDSRTTILGIMKQSISDLVTAIRDQAIELAAEWVVNQFAAMAFGIESAMTAATTATQIGVAGIMSALAPLLAVAGVLTLLFELFTGKASITGSINKWITENLLGQNYGTGTWKRSIDSYASGGIVAGALGEPRLAIVHGGEPIGAAGFAEAMDYTRFAEAVAAGVYDAMNDVLPGKETPIILQVGEAKLARAMYPALQREQQRLGLATT